MTASKPVPNPLPASPAAPQTAPPPESAETPAAFVAELLGRDGRPAAKTASMAEGIVVAWSEAAGMLEDGRAARLGASCLLRPIPGDQVLVWRGKDGECWVLAVLHRQDTSAPAVLATPGPVAVEAPKIVLRAGAVHIVSEELLTRARNHHAVEHTRTETCEVRVSQVGTDIRRVTTADEVVEGTLLQRAGTWISSTTRDARLRARTFLFD